MAGLGLLLSSLLLALPARAQTPLVIEGQIALTLSQGDTDARAAAFTQRLDSILQGMPSSLSVTTNAAVIAINGQTVLEVTPDDVAANAAQNAEGLAQTWAEQLQRVLNQPAVQDRLRLTMGLPPTITWQGRRLSLVPEPAQDLGRFTTDGSRVENRVIFWEAEADSPQVIYLLNANRQFVPYR